MTRPITAALLALWACGAAHSQPADQPLTFEVASVKPSTPRKPGEPQGRMGCFLAPRSKDRFLCTRASLSAIAQYAYDLKPYELRPAISKDTSEFNIEAKLPSGATTEQIPGMLRNLLSERFKLTFHREEAEVKGYALVVAKGGLKIKESMPDTPVPGEARPVTGPTRDADGFVYIHARNYIAASRANGLTRWAGTNVALDSDIRNAPRLTLLLYSLIGSPVKDATGLKGKYDFTLTVSSESVGEGALSAPSDSGSTLPAGDTGLTVFKAVEEQLGLKLEPEKLTVNLFVIDHAEKNPGGN